MNCTIELPEAAKDEVKAAVNHELLDLSVTELSLVGGGQAVMVFL